ncbi:MAG: type IV toxin-antitoxin system AbiEi family antitoxin domain-containing protein [Nitrospirota bacterium]
MSILACKPVFFYGTKTIEPTSRFWHKLLLMPFDLNETKDAILKPLQHHKIIDFVFDEEAIEILFAKSKGHPYFLKLLCHYIFRNAHASKTIVTRELLETIYPEILLSLAQDRFSSDLQIATDKEQSLLFACSQLADEFTLSDIKQFISGNPNEHVRRLVSKELLIQVKRGCYSFYHPLFKEFLLFKMSGKLS